MDDQRSERPHRGGLLELVGPAAVVGHGVAAEVVFSGRVVHQHHQDLAREVGISEVVPAVLRRLDAVADEQQLADAPTSGTTRFVQATKSTPASQSPPGSEEAAMVMAVEPTRGTACTQVPSGFPGSSPSCSNTPLR